MQKLDWPRRYFLAELLVRWNIFTICTKGNILFLVSGDVTINFNAKQMSVMHLLKQNKNPKQTNQLNKPNKQTNQLKKTQQNNTSIPWKKINQGTF